MTNTSEQVKAWHEVADELASMAQRRMVEASNALDLKAGALWAAAEFLTTSADGAAIATFKQQLEGGAPE